ncbi:MAG: hypothetical protein IPL49_00560 [Saprospirales bacterium]|nr:hypothetical protein [Saprospirales bacterium]
MKSLKIALLASFLGLVFSSCTIYEDGPLISILPKKNRIDNVWVADKVTNSNGNDITNNYDSWVWTFTVEGDAKVEFDVLGAGVVLNGSWNLLDNGAVFQLITDGLLGGIQEYDILRLTDKEFWVLDADGNEFHLQPR